MQFARNKFHERFNAALNRRARRSVVVPLFVALLIASLVLNKRPANLKPGVRKSKKVVGPTVVPVGPIQPVDCSTYASREPVSLLRMKSYKESPYVVSFGWWEANEKKKQFGSSEVVPAKGSSVRTVQRLLRDTEGAFVDIGANIGAMTHYGVAAGRTTYAFDPVAYNIAKICEGYRGNLERAYAQMSTALFVYHAAAGPVFQAETLVTRPLDEVGLSDQSSLSRDAVPQESVATEAVPMVPVDFLIPESVPVAVVKIDVQGHEYGVLQGIEKLLSREVNYPEYVYYEESPKLINMAGYKPGDCQTFLEARGYSCMNDKDDDVLCQRQ